MSFSIVRLNAIAKQAWKNNGGFTRELLAWPSKEQWVLRLSVATIEQSGPFSVFDGVTRWFAVLSGDGVRLSTVDHKIELSQASPIFKFDGGQLHACDLIRGSTTDFNVMSTTTERPCSVVRVRDQYKTRFDPLQGDSKLIGFYSNCDQTVLSLQKTSAPQISNGEDVQEIHLRQGELFWQIFSADDLALSKPSFTIRSSDAISIEIGLLSAASSSTTRLGNHND